jgi:hypothetical protein
MESVWEGSRGERKGTTTAIAWELRSRPEGGWQSPSSFSDTPMESREFLSKSSAVEGGNQKRNIYKEQKVRNRRTFEPGGLSSCAMKIPLAHLLRVMIPRAVSYPSTLPLRGRRHSLPHGERNQP